MRFDFLDAQLPWYEHGEETDCFAFPVPPALQGEKAEGEREKGHELCTSWSSYFNWLSCELVEQFLNLCAS